MIGVTLLALAVAQAKDLTGGELGAAGQIIEEGEVTVPALFGRVRAPVGGPFEVSSNMAQDLAGPNVALKVAALSQDKLGLALIGEGWALWKGNGFGGEVGVGFTYGSPTDDRVNVSLRYGGLKTVARIETLEIQESQKTLNTTLGYDLVLKPSDLISFGLGVDPLSKDEASGLVAAGSVHYVHGWDKLRLSVGADLVHGTIPKLGSEDVDQYIPDGKLLPFPHLNLWWKL